MITNLSKTLYSHPLLGNADLQEIAAAHAKIQFSKGDVILEVGKMANEYYLIEKGLFRTFVHDYNGNEITTEFFSENEILIEVSSLFQRIPSQETIVAITDAVVWKIDFQDFQELFHKIEGFREWGRAWMSQQLFTLKQRQVIMVSNSASQRYLSLLNENPQIIQHASLKHIASYLGVTDSSLSRIRKEILHN